MKAIRTKYIPSTNTKGSRISATTGEKGQRVIMSYDHSGKEHEQAARALADKMGWKGDFIGGGFPDGTMVWVFAESPDRIKRTADKWRVTVNARKLGSIGILTERLTYEIEAKDRHDAAHIAIERAHRENNLEHVRVLKAELI